MYAVLGDVQFELITYFDGLEAKFGVDYAEHALIGRKPRLQWVGDKLDEFQLDLVFHINFCDPEIELLKLRQALQSRQARQFVLGNGEYKGWFVMTELVATSRHTDKLGGLMALEARVTLREFVEPQALEARKAQAKQDAKARRAAAPKKMASKPPEPPVLDARDGWAKNGSRGAVRN